MTPPEPNPLRCDRPVRDRRGPLTQALQKADSVYVQTNSRALSEEDAVTLVGKIKTDGETAALRLGEEVRFVLRGDSTLRGHVFADRRSLPTTTPS